VKTRKLVAAISAVLVGTAVLSGGVFAKGKATVELGNNLSFAAKIVGGGGPALRLACSTIPQPEWAGVHAVPGVLVPEDRGGVAGRL